MSTVGFENRLPIVKPANNRASRIHDRQSERHHGYNQGDGRRAFHGAGNGNRRQHVAQEHTAGVTHENLGRTEIKMQKAERAAGQRRRHNGNKPQLLIHGHQEDSNRSYDGNPCSQSVQSINQIQHVGQTDHP